MDVKEELHHIVDHIPEADLATARKMLGSLIDPFELALLLVPYDDEPESEEERLAVEAALRDGEDIPYEEVLRRAGI